jgi:predicted amidophosphoribosyltransferase
MSKKKSRSGTSCLNCGNALQLTDQYCAGCGQKNVVNKLTFGETDSSKAKKYPMQIR